MGIKKWFNALFKKDATAVFPLDEEKILSNEIILSQQKKIASHEGTIGSLLAEKRLQKAEEKSKERERKLIGKLKEQEKEIHKKKVGVPFSLLKFFSEFKDSSSPIASLFSNNLRGQIEVTDKEGKEVIALLGDIAVIDDSYLGLYDIEGNLIWSGKDVSQIIYKPEALRNYIKTKQIRIPAVLDKEGKLKPFIDLENAEVPVPSYNKKDNRYDISEELTEKMKNQVIDKDKMLRMTKSKLEEAERIILGLKEEKEQAERLAEGHKTTTETAKVQISQMFDSVKEIQLHNSTVEKENALLLQNQAMMEIQLTNAQASLKEIMAKMQQMGIMSDFEKALAQVFDIMDNLQSKTAKEYHVHQAPEKKEEAMATPGQKVR